MPTGFQGVLDVISGARAGDYDARAAEYGELQKLKRKSLWDTMTEKRLKGAMGQVGAPQEVMAPDVAGPPTPAQPGTGFFSADPQEQLQAQILMANINPQAFTPMLTSAAGAPAKYQKAVDVKAQEEAGQMARQLQKQEYEAEHPFKPGQTRTIRKGEGFKTEIVTQEYQSDGSWKEIARGSQFRPATGGGKQLGFTQEDIDSLADKVIRGELAPSDLGKRGGIQVALASAVERKSPGFSLIDAEANSKYRRMSQTLQSIGLSVAVVPLFSELRERAIDLNNTNIPLWNKIKNATQEQLGRPEIVEFNQLRDDLVSESQRLMTGASVSSQARYDRAVENLKSSLNYKQLNASLSALEDVIAANLEARRTKPFEPAKGPEVVVEDLPSGFVMQPDGTALNPQTGQIARRQ